MANSSTIETVPFTYKEIYDELKTGFNNAGYDVAEGSNVSMLNSSMAYLISMLNANTAVNINENILDYATKRENIVQAARTLGYEIRHITSYVYSLTLSIPAGIISIPKYTEFTSNGHTYYYLDDDLYFENELAGTISLRVKEGTLHKYEDEETVLKTILSKSISDTNDYYIDVPYTNVEEEGISMYVSYYDTNDTYHEKELWQESDQTMLERDQTLVRKYLRIDDISYQTPRLYIRYAAAGYELRAGSIIYVNALVSHGADGKADGTFKSELPYEVSSVTLVQSGQSEESSQSIKNNAPMLYNSASRLVVANDYQAACNRDTRVGDSIVWGGEDEFPMSPGHIWFSFLKANQERSFTSDDDKVLFTRENFSNNWNYINEDTSMETASTYFDANYVKNTEIRADSSTVDSANYIRGIWDIIDEQRIPTLEFHHRQPVFMEFDYDISVLKYNIYDNRDETHQEIFNVIDNAFTGSGDNIALENFGVEYFDNSVVKRIDEVVTDISGFNHTTNTKLCLNIKNVCAESTDTTVRDIYIPLAMPYESVFTGKGYLDIDKIPSIDTENFVNYVGERGQNLYTDWSVIKQEIADGIAQSSYKMIFAPIKIKRSDTETITDPELAKINQFTLAFRLYPDDATAETPSYDGTTIQLYQRNPQNNEYEPTVLTYGAEENGYTFGDKTHTIIISADKTLATGDYLTVSTDQLCGYYYIFNTLKQEILIHMFVDGSEDVSGFDDAIKGSIISEDTKTSYLYTIDDYYMYTKDGYYMYTEGSVNINKSHADSADTIPRTYLYSSDGKYFYTSDSYYLTTEGYAVNDPTKVDTYTGTVVRQVTKAMYTNSPLKRDLFFRNRYLNLKYASNNFKVIKNVIPMLNSVTFSTVS